MEDKNVKEIKNSHLCYGRKTLALKVISFGRIWGLSESVINEHDNLISFGNLYVFTVTCIRVYKIVKNIKCLYSH